MIIARSTAAGKRSATDEVATALPATLRPPRHLRTGAAREPAAADQRFADRHQLLWSRRSSACVGIG